MRKMLMFGLVLMLPVLVFAQNTRDFKITNILLKLNGEQIEAPAEMDFQLTENVTEKIMVHRHEGDQIYMTLTMKQDGERIKLVRIVQVQEGNGNNTKSRKRKDVIFMKTGYQESMSTKVAESLLCDKDSMQTWFISFDYSLKIK